MDIHNLEAFIEVADKKSFSRSAESLKLTQPAVSKRIAALENELSSRLFDRMGRSVRLTEAGKVLLPSALKIYSEVSRIEEEISNLGNEVKGKLRIGLEEHVPVERLTPMLRGFRESYSDVVIDMSFTSTGDVLGGIESGIFDLGLCSIDSEAPYAKAHSRMRHVELWSDQMMIVVERIHPLALFESVTLVQLAKYPAILPKQNSILRKAIDSAMLKQGLTPLISMETDGIEIAHSMAAIGLGWTFLPTSVTDASLVTLKVENIDSEGFRLKNSVGLVRDQGRSMSRAARAFLDSLQMQFL